MEESNKKIINIALLVIWLAVIFYLSNQPGIQSSSLSDNLTLSIFSTVSDSLIVFVRKSAHISEFFILALLMYNVFKDYFTINKSFLLTLIFSILYACIDEIHQIFIIGRECLVRDVFIDAIGIIIALILIKVYITCKNNLAASEKINKK